MKIKETETEFGFRFTEVYPFHDADATDAETCLAGHFEVVHPSIVQKTAGIRINMVSIDRKPYTLEEIDTYIAGLQKAREIAAGLADWSSRRVRPVEDKR